MPETTINPELLEILRCPADRSRLKLADAQLLAKINQAATAGTLRNVAGAAVEETCDAGLLREDGQVVYTIVDGIPKLLVDEGIPMEQFP